MIGKRLTESKDLVSHYDVAFVEGFTEEQKADYISTLDIDKLEGLAGLRDKPTVFTVSPLQSKYEHMTQSNPPDAWGIFSTHVASVKYCDGIDFKWTGGIMESQFQDEIAPVVVQNIASMIIALSNITSNEAFFLQSVGSLHFNQAVMRQRAMKRTVTSAPTKAVKRKRSK